MATAVIFRTDRQGSVFALMPEIPADNNGHYCTAYEHLGQHSTADYALCIARSRPANPDDYSDLLFELEKRGYRVDVYRRATPSMHERRRMAAFSRPSSRLGRY